MEVRAVAAAMFHASLDRCVARLFRHRGTSGRDQVQIDISTRRQQAFCVQNGDRLVARFPKVAINEGKLRVEASSSLARRASPDYS